MSLAGLINQEPNSTVGARQSMAICMRALVEPHSMRLRQYGVTVDGVCQSALHCRSQTKGSYLVYKLHQHSIFGSTSTSQPRDYTPSILHSPRYPKTISKRKYVGTCKQSHTPPYWIFFYDVEREIRERDSCFAKQPFIHYCTERYRPRSLC